jgi:hypothetical protein
VSLATNDDQAMRDHGCVEIAGRWHLPLRQQEDYFRLLGAFDERARAHISLKQALGREAETLLRIPKHHVRLRDKQQAVVHALQSVMLISEAALDSMRPIVQWESKHGHH